MALRTKPADEFRLRRIKTTIRANRTSTGEVWFNVKVVRLYLEGDQWQESTKFGRDDLPVVAKAAEMAFAMIWLQSRLAPSEQPDPTVAPGNEYRRLPESTRLPCLGFFLGRVPMIVVCRSVTIANQRVLLRCSTNSCNPRFHP